jgi:2-polyprenyl-3-methyl-5-hydroxy-6-metoxy-1,4-benzoquinol methylase
MRSPSEIARAVRSKLKRPNTDPYRIYHREDIYASGPPVDDVFGELLDYVVQHSGPRVLDIGCGVGPYVAALNQRGFQAEGIELDMACVRRAQELGRPVKRMDATKLSYADNSFDTCILIEVVEHLEAYEKALREAGRVARRNLIISVPAIDSIAALVPYHVIPRHLLEPTHVNFFSMLNLTKLIERLFPGAGCVVEGYSRFFDEQAPHLELFYQLRALVSFTDEPPAATPETPQDASTPA